MKRVLLVVLIATLVAVSGCNGGDDSQEQVTPTVQIMLPEVQSSETGATAEEVSPLPTPDPNSPLPTPTLTPQP